MSSILAAALSACDKVLQTMIAHKEAGPFLEPVAWEELQLKDYPKVIKHPMDLGSVQARLKLGTSPGGYSHPKEFKHDVNLVWNNCMTYNVEGSPYYLVAAKLKQIFEERYAKVVRDEDETVEASRLPSLMDKKMLSQNIYNISSEDLGRVVHILDQRCDSCIKKIDPEDIEIDIDAIDAASFWTVDAFVKECLPGARKSGGGKKAGPATGAGIKPAAASSSSSSAAAAAASSSSAAAADSKAKKPRI